MPVFSSILVPTDFSETAGQALELAVAIAAESGAKLRVLHVCQSSPVRYAIKEGFLEPGDDDAEVARKVSARLEPSLAEFVATHGDGAEVATATRFGDPSREIVADAREYATDLVVMGRRGRTLADVMLGSVAERVVRHSPCPVLIATSDFD
jgi:nucleotide-binding universal stress UspA family protein